MSQNSSQTFAQQRILALASNYSLSPGQPFPNEEQAPSAVPVLVTPSVAAPITNTPITSGFTSKSRDYSLGLAFAVVAAVVVVVASTSIAAYFIWRWRRRDKTITPSSIPGLTSAGHSTGTSEVNPGFSETTAIVGPHGILSPTDTLDLGLASESNYSAWSPEQEPIELCGSW